MKRLFYEERLYDYTSIAEAEKHIKEMRSKGWTPKRQNEDDYIQEPEYIYRNMQDKYMYSVHFYKNR